MERYGRRQQSAFERDVKAFVWDHRQQIDVNAISDARLIDAAVCILRGRYRYDGFRTYASSDRFEAWCREIGAAGS